MSPVNVKAACDESAPHHTTCGCVFIMTLTVDLEDVFAAGSAVQLVRVLRDDHHGAALLSETGLALGYGHVRSAGFSLQR